MISPQTIFEGGEEGERKKRVYTSRICLLGVKCNYRTDDPFFLSLFSIAVRATWIIYGIFCISYYFIQPGCTDPQFPTLLTASLIGMLALHVIILLIFIAVAIISNLGSLRRPKPHRKNVFMLHVLLVFLLLELGWLLFSTSVAATEGLHSLSSNCTSYQHTLVLYDVSVAFNWVTNVFMVLLFLLCLDPFGCCMLVGLQDCIKDIQVQKEATYEGNSVPRRQSRCMISLETCSMLWQPCLCCRDKLNHYSNTAINDIAKIIGILFGDFDISFSDLVAGLLLVGHYQKELYKLGKRREEEMRKVNVRLLKANGYVLPTYETPEIIPLTKQEVEELSPKCRAYFKYTLAVYCGLNGVADSPIRSAMKNCQFARAHLCYPYYQSEHYEEDDFLRYVSVLATTLNIPRSDIVTASFCNSVFEVPFFVTYNSQTKELIITIRGTLSIQDALTDFSVAIIRPPDGLLGVKDAYIHRGFYESAEFVYKKLLQNKRFKDIVTSNEISKFLFTGHSLGAAVASILAIFFKERHKNKPWASKVEAFLFATPGAVMNYSLAEKTSDFMITVVASNDIVPRASVRSVGYLRLMVETLLTTAESSKSQALCCVGGAHCQCCPPQVPCDEDLVGFDGMVRNSSKRDGDYERLTTYVPFRSLHSHCMEEDSQMLEKNISQRTHNYRHENCEQRDQTIMFMPGRVLHLEESEQSSSSCFQSSNLEDYGVTGKWKARESFSTILIHPNMIRDHLPERYINHCVRFSYEPIQVTPVLPSQQQNHYIEPNESHHLLSDLASSDSEEILMVSSV